ncbi:hypothetical protein [Tissierella sp.]|uniref:hypothetical protein n=1 Tax=Tissierella sp. TaxID=41274 RepID=UPI00285945C4|nr:hypothetical protein [Tissierella sp.]MDR7855996.1 hypothetical protein [Tissierella sp.]
MRIRKFLFCIFLSILLLPHISYGASNNPKVYLVVMNKLTLKDIEAMDYLNTIILDGSIGLMNTRGTTGYTGAESFLTINSSRKAYANYSSIDFQFQNMENSLVNNSISKIYNLNKENNYLPSIGAIGDNLHNSGLKTAIYGNGDVRDIPNRTSALIPMDSKGLIDYGNIDNITLEESEYPFGYKTDYETLLTEVVSSQADFIVVDTGDLQRMYSYSANISDEDFISIRERILRDLDNFLKDLIDLLDSNNSLLIITSPNSGDMNVDDSRLSPIVLWGEGIERGTIASLTTNRQSLVTNLDIGPTVMEYLKAPKEKMSGNPIETIRVDIELDDIIKLNKQINTTSRVRFNTLYYYGLISIILLSIAIIIVLTKIKITSKIETVIKSFVATLLFIPNILFIVSLFKPVNILIYIMLLLIFLLLFFIIIWRTKENNNQLMYISAFSVFVIFLDLLLKGSISKYSVLSHDPIIGARYYGIGNEMVGILLGSVTLLSIRISEKNNKSLLPLILFSISVIMVGHPLYGANVGGTMAFIMATIIYIFNFMDKEITIKRALYLLLCIIISISLLGYIDIKFNENTTHLGNSILLIKNNGIEYLTNIVIRKVLMNIKLIGNSFWTYVLLFNMIFHLIVFNALKEINKKALIALIAGIAGIIGGFLLNDSGLLLASIAMNLISTGLYLEYM